MCVFLLFLMHGHSYERICMKFGSWHHYTLWMVMSRLTSAGWARGLALRVPSIHCCKWLASSVGKYGTSRRQVQWIKRRRQEGGPLVKYIWIETCQICNTEDWPVNDKKLCYCRGTMQRAMLVNSGYVSRGMGVRKVSNSKSDLQGYSSLLAMVPVDRPRMISYKFPLQLCLYLALLMRYYHFFPKI